MTASIIPMPVSEERATVRSVVQYVSRISGVPVTDIYGRVPRGPAAKARQAAMYLARVKTGKSYPQIGRVFGRHHTTVMDAVRAVEARPHLYPIGTCE